MNKKILTTCAVLALIVCLLLSVISLVFAFFVLQEPETLAVETAISSPLPALTEIPTTEADTLIPATPDTSEKPQTEDSNTAAEIDIPPGVLVEMELIQRQVIEERRLDATGTFTRVLYTKDQLNQRLVADFEEDFDPQEEAESAIVLEVFGLLNKEFDLYNFYLDLFTEQIAGFYDNETKEMVVILGEDFGGPERLTYAHEYTHALQDQHYDIRNGLKFNDDTCEADTERCAAVQALLEGDASLSELSWFQEHATIEDQREIIDFYEELQSPMLDSAPSFIAKDLLFPYEAGYTFVEYLYQRGGWDAVDQAYLSPPVTTEQIIHPEKYPDDPPITITIPDLLPVLGTSWNEIDRNVMGEWYTYLILAHGLDEDARLRDTLAEDAAEGWDGDEYVVYHHPEEGLTVMAFKTVWESSSQAKEFTDAFRDYAQERFGKAIENSPDFILWEAGEAVHALFIDGVYTTWIAAPNPAMITTVWEAIQGE